MAGLYYYNPEDDPALELLRRRNEIQRRITDIRVNGIDQQEMREREEASQSYAGENPQHFESYVQDCIDQSVKANKDIREIQMHCYRTYLENEPVNYGRKEAWQSRIIVPKPFGTVQYGASAVKRAFTPKFLSVSNFKNKSAGEFWQKMVEYQLNEQHAQFVIRFTDATTMALAVGISMEMIPQWIPGRGLSIALIEPWKIHRDPDAAPRDPQSGLYWVHQEWLDWHVLKAGEQAGKYENVDRIRQSEQAMPDNPWLTQESIAKRKNMVWERSSYRPMYLTSEFYGTILSPKGEMLLPLARLTTAAGRIIQKPQNVSYRYMRWPGIAFSPMPDLLKFNGRGLLEGIMSTWEAMNNMMCLHQDYMQWVVNPMTEINVDALVDPADVETYPGKEYLTRDTIAGQQAVRTVQRRSNTNDILANMQYHDQNYQRGSFVPDAVQGLPGYRKDMTFREASQNLDQALGVYSLMGENIETGAIYMIQAASEFIRRYATWQDYAEIFQPEELQQLGIMPNANMPNGIAGVPEIDGSFHVSGIQTLMKDNETLANIKNIIIPLANNPAFAPYINPYRALKAIEIRTNMKDEKIIAAEDEAKAIEAQNQMKTQEQEQAIRDAQDLQAAHGIADLSNKMTPQSAPA
ncbi:MAG TPA: hypothetical protein PLC82_12285 [Smithellaceae bacterium]|nr:hypothetical protein [Smithellaceae bacterium]